MAIEYDDDVLGFFSSRLLSNSNYNSDTVLIEGSNGIVDPNVPVGSVGQSIFISVDEGDIIELEFGGKTLNEMADLINNHPTLGSLGEGISAFSHFRGS